QGQVTGDIQMGWIAPLDVTGRVQRATVPLASLQPAPSGQRPHEMFLGWLLAADGSLGVFPVARGDRCSDGLLTRAGVAIPLGGCAEEPSVAVELGGRLFVLHATPDGLAVSAAPARRAARAPRDREIEAPISLRELARIPTGGSLRAFSLGAGA